MTRRAFLLMCAAAIVPTPAPRPLSDRVQYRGRIWTVDGGDVKTYRTVYTGTYQWKYQYVTASGETLASRVEW